MSAFKKPVSVLVVIHTTDLEILLLERAAHPGYWQSVTGSQEENETLLETACREVAEETGIVVSPHHLVDWHLAVEYEIFPHWRQRYAPGVTVNTEHCYSLHLAQRPTVQLSEEHRNFLWLPQAEAAEKVFSASNRDAILALSHPTHITADSKNAVTSPPL